MLRHLSLRNFVLVDALDLELDPGFAVLTGETGAGKSILLDALGLLLGDRFEVRQIRHGAERAEIATRYADWEITGPGEERRLADDCSNPTRGRRPSSSTSPASASKGPSMLPVLVPALVKTARWWSFPTRYPTHDAARAMDLRGRWSTSPP